MSFGPNPWQQAHWDWRAAGNFMAGGAGGGLIVATALSGAQGSARALLLLAGVALVGLGLACVWLEIGRPWRALNVFRQPQRSWMAREAIVATLLFPVTAAAALAWPALAGIAAALALAFVYCQSRMLSAARGIPAWRAPLLAPLILATGLTEGAGLWVAAAPWHGGGAAIALALAVLVLVRFVVWRVYWRGVAPGLAARARVALDAAGKRLVIIGTALPLLGLAGVAAFGNAAPSLAAAAAIVAGVSAAVAGAGFKFALITRAAYNQGFALTRLPVRGVRRA